IELQETVLIYELSMAIALAFDSATIVRKMADAAFQQGDAGAVAVFLPVRDGKEWSAAVALGEYAERIKGKRVPMTESVPDWIAGTPVPNFAGMLGVSIPMAASGR